MDWCISAELRGKEIDWESRQSTRWEYICIPVYLMCLLKAEGSPTGTPQQFQSDIVRSEAFRNAFRSFEAGLIFFFSRLMFFSSTPTPRL